MDRRTAIRNLALVLGGTALLPYCTTSDPVAHYKNFDINLSEQQLITDIAETIIPKTNTPGAKDLNLYSFIAIMLDDCTKKEDQDAFFRGLKEFFNVPIKMFGYSFAECNPGEKEMTLVTFEKKNTYSKDLMSFYGQLKGLTVFGYTQSKYFMTKEIVYELVPGRYNAYYPVKNNLKAGATNG